MDWTFLVGRGKKNTRSYALSSLEMVKGKRIKTLREKREGGGRRRGGRGENPVSNQASGSCREEVGEKWAWAPNCDKRWASQKTRTTHTPHQGKHKHTPPGLQAGPGGARPCTRPERHHVLQLCN